jgi:hypothetical protein
MRISQFLSIIVATSIVLLSSCAENNPSSRDQSSTVVPSKSPLALGSRLKWMRNGGGNLEFTISKVTPGEYSIHVSSFDYQKMNTTLRLDQSDSMFSTVESIISGSFKIPSFTPSAPTGAWLKIAISRDSEPETTTTDVDFSDTTLQSVENWVRVRLPKSG